GNFIGTNAAGDARIPNGDADGSSGVTIFRSANNTIGGTAPGARNLISGNSLEGVLITGSGATDNRVLGNFIGTDAAGTGLVQNRRDGVLIEDAANNTVGGFVTEARNVVSGSDLDGIGIEGTGATGNVVAGNYVGLDATGNGRI